MRKLLRRFRDDVSGLTLIESTFIMIILLSIMVSGIEVLRYYRLARHLQMGAESFADVMGQRRAPLRDLNWSEDASALVWLVPEVPAEWGADWREALGVQATYARFMPDDPACQTDCLSTSARILWTWGGGSAGSLGLLNEAGYLRDCEMRLVPNSDDARLILPSDLFKGKDVLAITLVASFKPRFLASLIKQKLIIRHAYVPTPADRLLIDPLGVANEVMPCL